MANKKDYRVKVKFGDAEVEVEGAESGVVKIVQALSEVLRGARRPSNVAATTSPISLSVTPGQRPTGQLDIRSFFTEKKPSSDIEAAATAAYYFQYVAPNTQRRETIDSAFCRRPSDLLAGPYRQERATPSSTPAMLATWTRLAMGNSDLPCRL